MQEVQPCSRWATATEGNTWCHCTAAADLSAAAVQYHGVNISEEGSVALSIQGRTVVVLKATPSAVKRVEQMFQSFPIRMENQLHSLHIQWWKKVFGQLMHCVERWPTLIFLSTSQQDNVPMNWSSTVNNLQEYGFLHLLFLIFNLF